MSETLSTLTNGDESRRNARGALVGLLVIQLLVGYEWFMSGLTKLYRGGFPGGLAAELRDKSIGAEGWYRSFLKGSIIPHASVFGYALEIGEFLVGVALIAATLVWLLRYERLSDRIRVAVLATTIVASLGGIFMAVNFHIANGAPHAWLIPKSGFDESVDLDSLLPAVELVMICVSVGFWRSLRGRRPLMSQLLSRFEPEPSPTQKKA